MIDDNLINILTDPADNRPDPDIEGILPSSNKSQTSSGHENILDSIYDENEIELR